MTIVSHRAPRQRQLADLMSERAYTLSEAATATGMSEDAVRHALGRLPALLELQELGDELEPRYRVLFPAGRVCEAPGCTTVLRRSHASERCELHGKPAYPTEARAPEPKRRRVGGQELRAARRRQGMTTAELAELANIDPAFLRRLERGRFVLTVALERRLSQALGLSLAPGTAL